jgi:hypothetical protein
MKHVRETRPGGSDTPAVRAAILLTVLGVGAVVVLTGLAALSGVGPVAAVGVPAVAMIVQAAIRVARKHGGHR